MLSVYYMVSATLDLGMIVMEAARAILLWYSAVVSKDINQEKTSSHAMTRQWIQIAFIPEVWPMKGQS